MKKNVFLVTVIIGMITLHTSCRQEGNWQVLFNGENLENWDMFLGSSLGEEFDSLAQNATMEKVFSVVEEDGQNVIRISGEINGSLATQQEFENYHARLVYKWGETVYSRRNSGFLYHSFGDFGVAFGTWMPNVELQLMHQNLGDTYLMANTACEISAEKIDETGQFVFNPQADMIAFGEHAQGRLIRKNKDMEKPLGQWNTVDLYCLGDKAIHVVNGETVMVNENISTYTNGTTSPLSSGKIQIQSEGAELFVKSLDVRPIREFPAEILP